MTLAMMLISAMLQLIAALAAIRVWYVRRSPVWLLLSSAMALMLVRRVHLAVLAVTDPEQVNLGSEALGVLIALLLTCGALWRALSARPPAGTGSADAGPADSPTGGWFGPGSLNRSALMLAVLAVLMSAGVGWFVIQEFQMTLPTHEDHLHVPVTQRVLAVAVGFGVVCLVIFPVAMLLNHLAYSRSRIELLRTARQLESERRTMSTLLGNLPGMAYRCLNQPSWPMSFVSQGCQDLTGYSAGEITASRPAYGEVILPEDRQRVWDTVAAAVSGRDRFHLHYRILTRDGRVKSVWEQGVAVEDASGVALEGFIIDVTDRDSAAEALADSEERLRLALEGGELGIFDWDLRSGQIVASQRHMSLFGLHPESFDGTLESYLRHIHPDDLPAIEPALETARRQRTMYHLLFRVPRPDGSLRWVRGQGRYVYQGTEAVRLVGVAQDVTEQHRAEERLRETQVLLSSLMDHAPMSIYITGTDGRYRLVNRAWEQRIGREPGSSIGLTAEELVPPATARRFRESDRRVLEEDRAIEVEQEVELPDQVRYYRTIKFPLRDGRGRITSIGGVSMDITDRVAAERALRQLNEQLEQRVRQRTAELESAYQRLRQEVEQREKAQALAQRQRDQLAHVSRLSTIGEMATALAHELNQPLAAIGNYSDGLIHRIQRQPTLADPLVTRAVERMGEQARRAGEIIRRMRQFVRRRETTVGPVAPADLVGEVARLLEAELRERGVELTIRAPDDLPRVSADAIQIQQVLVNLIRNAADAATAAGVAAPRVALAVRRRDDQPRLEFVVRDNGPGVPPERRPDLFEAFRSTKPDGMGLGLSISRSIIEAHDGRLWLDEQPADPADPAETADPDRGAVFRFTLPVYRRPTE